MQNRCLYGQRSNKKNKKVFLIENSIYDNNISNKLKNNVKQRSEILFCNDSYEQNSSVS